MEDGYEKPFEIWGKYKRVLHSGNGKVLFHEREVWWCSLGINVGSEQDGKHEYFERPVLILKKFSRDVFLAAPITSNQRIGPYYFQLPIKGKQGSIVLSQIRTVSVKRLNRLMCKIPQNHFEEIRERLCYIIKHHI